LTNLWNIDRGSAPSQLAAAANEATKTPVFCHDFDLSKRLTLPAPPLLNCIALPQSKNILVRGEDTAKSPFAPLMQYLISQLGASSPSTIHRVIIPALLSPALYPHSASKPQYVLQFIHGLRSLLRKYSNQLTVLMSLPISLFPRAAGLTRWIEILSDGVLELAPFPSHATVAAASSSFSGTGPQEEPPQGMLRVYRIPISSEKGGGGGEISGHGDDMAFTLSRRKGLVIKPYSLPPVDNDEDGAPEASHGKATKVDIEF
jgi:elongator complex protein 4